jgi:ABC-type transport system substrate-binding protein
MKRLPNANLMYVAMGVPLMLLVTSCATSTAATQDTGQQVVIVGSTKGPSRLSATGTTSDFGRYLAVGEIALTGGAESESLDGTGVAVVQAEDGDQIVADVAANTQEDGSTEFTFHWRDSAEFSDGTVVETTGRFVDDKPEGLKVSIKCKRQCIAITNQAGETELFCTFTCTVCVGETCGSSTEFLPPIVVSR